MIGVNSISGNVSGRRPGDNQTRSRILEAAQNQFAAAGYDGVTMRAIAKEAGVDAALIVHYFGTKQQLFVASMLPLAQAPQRMLAAIEGDRSTIGRRLAHEFVQLLSDDFTRKMLLGLMRSASSEEQASRMLRGFMEHAIVGQLSKYFNSPNQQLQATLLGGQIVGTVFARYILKVEPLASTSEEELAEWLAPRFQSFFDS